MLKCGQDKPCKRVVQEGMAVSACNPGCPGWGQEKQELKVSQGHVVEANTKQPFLPSSPPQFLPNIVFVSLCN